MTKPKQRSLFGEVEPRAGASPAAVHGAVVREVTAKSVLNRSGIDDYSFNVYTGCTHGCVYCYARYMQRFHPHDEAWGAFVDVKVNAADVLKKQVLKMSPGSVFTCSACDGWQEVEAEYKLTRRCCEILLDAGFHLGVLTKSELVLRDLDVFKPDRVRVGVTITTPDETEARAWEPRASSVADRLRVLREAKAAGFPTTVMFGPLLPAISDTPEALTRLFELARDADVDRVWTDVMIPRPRVWPSVRAFLRKHRPDLLEHTRRVLFDRTYREEYEKELDPRIRKA
ncbi:MAG TPA: radical SAM protein, partial [Planctomycetota bacterium]|nr:radical SAM protein [Planctomycetota bacterium]